MKRLVALRFLTAAGVLSVATSLAAAEGDAAKGDRDALFGRLDTDGDGVISKDEVPDAQQRMFERLLRNGDKNDDGKLSKEEFMAAGAGERPAGDRPGAASGRGGDTGRRPEGAEPQAEEIFASRDENKDGKLQRDEVPEERREGFDRMVEHFDADGDKALSLDEFKKGLAMMRSGGAAGAGQAQRAPEGRPGAGAGGMGGGGLFGALDTNHDGKLSGDEIAAASESLKKLDKDGDGTITGQEAFAGMPGRDMPRGGTPGAPGSAAGGGNEMAKQMIARADANGDGKLSKDEAPDRLRDNFDRVDRNGDGFVDASELGVVVGGGGRPGAPGAGGAGGGGDMAKQILSRNDANNDGKLSRDEAPDWMKNNFDKLDRNSDGFLEASELQAPGRRPNQ
ncbi:MAG TPA: hypothetical protein VHZ24_20090 [Pirellulales bacterium]|jgi:Ca2+-binding EF-hand superfamily protein|nr:hypothetical protein [Pirellulales bacterium]